MQRRPHWDDDLIDAVSESIPYPFPEVVIYSVIAAVEDWQATQVRELEVTVCECPPKAAIQRVRELCENPRVVMSKGCLCYTDECSGQCGAGKPLAWDLDPADVLRALDGDA